MSVMYADKELKYTYLKLLVILRNQACFFFVLFFAETSSQNKYAVEWDTYKS